MEEERRLAPRRLLSFDASQMSFSRLGKVLYPGSQPGRSSTGRKPEPVQNICLSTSYRSTGRSPFLCLASHPESHLAAAITKDHIELLAVDGASVSSLRTVKIGQKYLPTAAKWQGRHHWGHFQSSYVDSSDHSPSAGSSDVQSSVGGMSTDSLRLAVADSGGVFRVYESNSSLSSLSLMQTSITSGRAINSLSFSAAQPNTLATAVSDGSVRLWDLRQESKRPFAVFQRPGDIAREVQFQPENDHKFACIHDSGVVQRWDIRQRQGADFRISAHQQGLSLDWHPTQNYLATGGRDHLVQVWNMSAGNPTDLLGGASSPEMTISTPNSVSKIQWAVTFPNESVAKAMIITSGRPIESNSTKGMYACWSLSRPWIPQHAVEAHSDAVTDLSVVGPTTVWSVGRDGRFAQTDLRYESQVDRNLSPVIVDWPPWDIAAVCFPTKSPSVDGAILAPPHPLSRARSQTPGASSGSIHDISHRKSSFAPIPQSGGTHSTINRTMSMANLSTSPSSLAHQLLSTSSNSASSSFGVANSNNIGSGATGSNAALQTPRSATPGTPNGSHASNYFQGVGEPSQQFVVEIGLPYITDKVHQGISSGLLYTREQNQTYAQVCEINADVMITFSMFQLAEIWRILGVAVQESEQSFLREITDKDEKALAEKWFLGQPVAMPAASVEDAAANAVVASEMGDAGVLYEDTETASLEDLEWGSAVNWEASSSIPRSHTTNLSAEESDASPSKWGTLQHVTRKRSGNSSDAPSGRRRQHASRKDAFQTVCDKFHDFLKQRKMPWDFIPILRDMLGRLVEMGLYVAAVSVLLVFRGCSYAHKDFKVDEIIEAALRSLNGTRSFVAAARIRNVICDDPDLSQSGVDLSALLEDTTDTPDTVCHRCKRSLSDNIAFYARNNAEVGFWYCSRCHDLLDGCSYCNEPVKCLAIVMLACGHRSHLRCWDHWTQVEKMNECPAGCGELISTVSVERPAAAS